MYISRICFLFTISLISFFLTSCGDDEPQPPVTSDKTIKKFELKTFDPAIEGVISNENGTIKFTLPMGTTHMDYAPTITLASGVTVSPASGASQNFSGPVVYTVTGKDGTKQYTVKAEVSEIASFTARFLSKGSYQYNGFVSIVGENFKDFDQGKIVLKNVSTNETYDIPLDLANSGSWSIKGIIDGIPVGIYSGILHLGQEWTMIEGTIEITRNHVSVTSFNKTTVKAGENLIIEGKYFETSGNIVELRLLSGASLPYPQAVIVSESSTLLEIKIPDDMAPGKYEIMILYVKSGVTIKAVAGNIDVTAPSILPKITSINKLIFQRGEVITITGKNLKKAGVATNINFMPAAGGVTLVRSGVANAEGTQVTFTIPNDFLLNTYVIAVEVDFEYSDDYSQNIQINP